MSTYYLVTRLLLLLLLLATVEVYVDDEGARRLGCGGGGGGWWRWSRSRSRYLCGSVAILGLRCSGFSVRYVFVAVCKELAAVLFIAFFTLPEALVTPNAGCVEMAVRMVGIEVSGAEEAEMGTAIAGL